MTSAGKIAGTLFAALMTVLLATCGSDDARSLVVLTVKAGTAVSGLTEVEVTVTPSPSGNATSRRFSWATASNGILQAGVYLPSGVSGNMTVSGRGFAGATPIAAAPAQMVHVDAGAASAAVELLLAPITGQPPGPAGDGGMTDAAGAGGAGGTGGGTGGTPGPGADAGPGGAGGAGGTGPVPGDAAPPVDAPITGADAAPDGPPVTSPNPPSLTRCSDVMHTVVACDLTTGVGDWGIRSVAFSPDSKFLVSAGEDGRVKVWRVTDAGLESDGRVFNGFGSTFAAFSPNGALLVVGNHNGEVVLYDFVQGTQAGVLVGLTGGVTAVGFSSDGTRVVAMDNEMHLQAWDVTTHASVRAVTLSKIPSNFAIAPGPAGSLVVALQDGENMPLQLLDLTRPDLAGAPSVAITGSVWGLAFSPDGNTLAVGNDAGEINLVNTSNRTQPMLMPPPLFMNADQDVTALAFSSDGQYLLAATGQFRGATAARIFTVSTRTPRGMQATTYFPWSAAFAPDGHSIAVGQRDCGKITYCKD